VSLYEAENATLSADAVTDYDRAGVSGSGTVKLAPGASSTFWVYSAEDAYSTLSFATFGGGAGTIAVNGTDVGSLSDSADTTVFLSGGVNKVTVTGASGALVLDRLAVSKPGTTPTPGVYEAEDATLTGSAAVRQLSLAAGGEAVGTIGGAPGNDSKLEFSRVRVDADGTYALTIRYSNEEQSPATHYNPDPLARFATLDVNGTTSTVAFPHSFHQNNFWELTVQVQLNKGDNTISFSSEEKPNFDGTTLISDQFPGVLLRSQYAPNIDGISVAPFVQLAGSEPGGPADPGANPVPGGGSDAAGTGSAGNGGKLAATGADWSFIGLLALLMLGAGAVVLRKKRRSQHS